MKNYSRQILGIVIGVVIASIGWYLMGDMVPRYALAILLLSAGLVILGLSSYHLKEARWRDSQNTKSGKVKR